MNPTPIDNALNRLAPVAEPFRVDWEDILHVPRTDRAWTSPFPCLRMCGSDRSHGLGRVDGPTTRFRHPHYSLAATRGIDRRRYRRHARDYHALECRPDSAAARPKRP